MSEPYLRMIGISKRFPGVQALDKIDMEAYPGEALALIGANGAGKSTLMNVLGGVVGADEGAIIIGGEHVGIHSPLDAAEYGITFVHQEMALLPTLTVAENMYIASFPTRSVLIDYEVTQENSRKALKRVGWVFDPRTKVRHLSPGDQQLVEIARALLSEPRIVIFDEPTSSLTSREKARLFEVIGSLKQEGVTIIYITHLLEEVFTVCERALVLRNGEVAGGGTLTDLTYDDIIRLMIGSKEVGEYFGHRAAHVGEPVLRVAGLSREGVLQDISFTLHKGEVLGLWGLLGSGRTELARALVGLDPINAGTIEVRTNGTMESVRPGQAKNWIGMITENRREEGLLLPLSVTTNMSLASLRALISRIWPLIDSKREVAQVKQFVARLNIAISGLGQPVRTLSGGNQQKVIVGRWLQRQPPIYIMDEPTRGLDVGAKAEIRNIITELSEEGIAILLITSDIDEIISLSDRFLVLNQGRITTELPASASKDELMVAAAGVS